MDKLNKKIWVVGAPGAGKTHLGNSVSNVLQVKHVELDSLIWQKDWQKREDHETQQALRKLLSDNTWIVDGNYPDLSNIIKKECDTILILRTPVFVRFLRVLNRSLHYCITNKELWNGNKENWSRLFSKDSMPLYVWKSWREENEKLNLIEYDHKLKSKIITLRNQRDIKLYLKNIKGKECEK